jgi:uncharacterized protein YqfA (UPF0365 family)
MNAGPNQNDFAAILVVVFALVNLLLLLGIALFFATLFGPWMRGFLGGAPVSVLQLLGMRLRGVPARLVVDAVVTLVHREHPYEPQLSRLVESTYLAQRGLIQSSTQLAEVVERQLPKAKAMP